MIYRNPAHEANIRRKTFRIISARKKAKAARSAKSKEQARLTELKSRLMQHSPVKPI